MLPCLGTGYDSSKAGAIHFSRSLAVDLAPHGIRVNAVSPGVVPVPTLDRMHAGEIEHFWPKTPVDERPHGADHDAALGQRAARPEGHADRHRRAVLFLVSEASSYVTGHNLVRRRRMDAGVSTPDRRPADPARRARDRQLVALRYCRALDTKDWRLLDDVFVADATADLAGPSPLVGIEAIRARIRTALEHLDVSQHLVGNHEVSVDGDTATHRCYLQAQHVRRAAAGGPNYIVAGRYEDRLARTDARLADRPPHARGDVDGGQHRRRSRRSTARIGRIRIVVR